MQTWRKLSGWLKCSLSHWTGASSEVSMPWITTRYFASVSVSLPMSIKSDNVWRSRSRSKCGCPMSENGRNVVCTTGKSGRWIRYGIHRKPFSPVESSISLWLMGQKVSNLSFTMPLHSCLCSFFCMPLITCHKKQTDTHNHFRLILKCLWATVTHILCLNSRASKV